MMRNTGYWLVLLLPLLLLICLVALRIVDPIPVSALRRATFDAYQQLRPRRLPGMGPAVVVVEIDGESRKRHGAWPWPRKKLATLLEKLNAANVRAAALLVDMSRADPASPQGLVDKLPESPERETLKTRYTGAADADKELAKAIAKRPTVIGIRVAGADSARPPTRKSSVTAVGDITGSVVALPGAAAAIQLLETAAAGNGVIPPPLPPVRATRQIPLVYIIGGNLYPTTVAELARLIQKARRVLLQPPSGGAALFLSATGLGQVRIGERVVPVDRRGWMWLHAAPRSAARRISAWQILDGKVPAAKLAGRVVLIALGSPNAPRLRTPLGDLLTQPLVLAQALEQILQRRFLTRPGFALELELGYAVLVSLFLMVLLSRVRGWPAVLMVIGAVALPLLVGWAAFVRFGWLLDGSMPAGIVLAVSLAAAVATDLRLRSGRQKLALRYQRNLPPRLMRRLSRSERDLPPEKETRVLTALNLNVRDFDTLLDRQGSATAAGLLRRLYSPATSVIFANGGTLDKFVGDRMLAFWNAPVEEAGHPERACRAALELMGAAAKLNERLRSETADSARQPELEVAIGLETGECFVGDAGAAQRFEYAAVGPPVSVAWRLSSQSRFYGVNIVAGPGVAGHADRFAFLELDLLRLYGRAPIRIYALLGDETLGADAAFRHLVAANASMLSNYRARRWADAQVSLNEARQIADGRLDTLYDLYAVRLRAFRSKPPPDDWDGAADATVAPASES